MKNFLFSRMFLNPKEAELEDKSHRTSRFSSRSPFRTTTPLSSTQSDLPSMDAPPAYTFENTASPGYSDPTSGDSQYAFLKEFDTVFVIDDSGSMSGVRWMETRKALEAIAPVCTFYDEDGIDIYFLNHRSPKPERGPYINTHTSRVIAKGGYANIRTSRDVARTFDKVEPRGVTPTGARLKDILTPYIERLKKKSLESIIRPLNIIVITDGAATDNVGSEIVDAAEKLDKLNAMSSQVGIQFFQVGKDPDATEDLKDLDDALHKKNKIRDMVDTVSYQDLRKAAEQLAREGQAISQSGSLSPEAILKVVTGAVNRRIDNRSVSDIKKRSILRG